MNTTAAILGPLVGSILAMTVGAAASDLDDAGKAAYSRGDYLAAEHLFNRALGQAPHDPLLHYHRGVTLMRLSRWREASAAFEAVLRLNPPADLAATARQGIRSLAPLVHEPAPRSVRGEETLVPLRHTRGNWFAEVRLNDTRTVRFVVDTGASLCVVSPEVAADLGVRPGPRAEMVPMQVVGGVTAGARVTLASMQVGDAEVENVAAVIHSIGPGIDRLLGNSFLGLFRHSGPRQGRPGPQAAVSKVLGPERFEATSSLGTSRAVDEEYRPEERDESAHRQMPGRSPAAHDEHPENDDRAHDLREGKRDERASPPEGGAQHRHQLDVAPAHGATAHDGDEEDHSPAHERTESGLDHGWIPGRYRGQAQRVRQPWQRDDVWDDPDPQVKDHDQRERAKQREKLPPPRRKAKSPKGQQGERDGQSRTARERDRPGDLGEPTRYLVDGDPVEGGAGIKRGAG